MQVRLPLGSLGIAMMQNRIELQVTNRNPIDFITGRYTCLIHVEKMAGKPVGIGVPVKDQDMHFTQDRLGKGMRANTKKRRPVKTAFFVYCAELLDYRE